MTRLFENFDLLLDGFWTTLLLTGVSAVCALVLGTILGSFRVSPIAPLRWFGAAYVEIVRNTPLTIVFFAWVFVVPRFDVILEFKTSAYIALSLYTAAFVCEAVRSGINSVATGHAEAARSIGMTFGKCLGTVILPLAFWPVIPPLINIFVALTKNSSVAAGFFVTEVFATGRDQALRYPSDAAWFLCGVAFLYLVITVPAGIFSDQLERKVAIAR